MEFTIPHYACSRCKKGFDDDSALMADSKGWLLCKPCNEYLNTLVPASKRTSSIGDEYAEAIQRLSNFYDVLQYDDNTRSKVVLGYHAGVLSSPSCDGEPNGCCSQHIDLTDIVETLKRLL